MIVHTIKNTLSRLAGLFKSSPAIGERLSVENTLCTLFQLLNITWTVQAVKHDGIASEEKDYHFQFQNGNFYIMAREGRSFVRIRFPFFLETAFGTLDNVRYACNEFNQQYGDFKVIYSLNEREHRIDLHVMASFRLSPIDAQLRRDFASTLTMCFEAARCYSELFDAIQENDDSNLEESNAMNARERYLANECELMNQNGRHQWRSNKTEHHELEQLFCTLFEARSVQFHRLRVIREDLTEKVSPEEIAHYDLTACLIRHDENGALFVHESATLLIEASLEGRETQEYVLHLHAQDEAEDILYMRLTLVSPTLPYSPTHSHMVAASQPKGAYSFLLAYDANGQWQREAEFDYVWKEMNALVDEGKPLSEEQQFLAFCTWPNVGYNLYWGRRLFAARRYYDALRHFENAYIALNQHYHGLRKSAREKFHELAYYIGFSYAELGLYRQAYYYLDIVFPQNDFRYMKGYVNMLSNSGDFRALSIINSLLQNLSSHLSEEDVETENAQQARRLLSFLKRRKSFVLIGIRQLDEAESLLQELLHDEESEAFALQQLLYIQELREHSKPSSSLTS